jgi:transposase-like protein
MAKSAAPKTLQEAIIHYADLDVCQQELVAARWPDGVECPVCGRKDVTYLANQRRWQCKGTHGKRQFSAKVGTIFEDSPISLSKWFAAIWLIASAKNGISSYEIHRGIGVTQKTAWFMLHRIRLAMQTGSFRKMSGEVEVDETYIGGKARFMHKDKREKVKGSTWMGKIAVLGLLERHGEGSRVRTAVVRGTRRGFILPQIKDTVEPGSQMYTDALQSYQWGHGLPSAYMHKFIDHAEGYVQGNVHTNGLENYWSLLKRTIKGTYVSVEPFHLFRYLDEQAFRFNTRKASDAVRFNEMAARVVGKRLTYAQLIGERHEQSA